MVGGRGPECCAGLMVIVSRRAAGRVASVGRLTWCRLPKTLRDGDKIHRRECVEWGARQSKDVQREPRAWRVRGTAARYHHLRWEFYDQTATTTWNTGARQLAEHNVDLYALHAAQQQLERCCVSRVSKINSRLIDSTWKVLCIFTDSFSGSDNAISPLLVCSYKITYEITFDLDILRLVVLPPYSI